MRTQLSVDSQAYLEGRLTDQDYKAILYSLLNKSRDTQYKQLAGAILFADTNWLHIFARNIVNAGE